MKPVVFFLLVGWLVAGCSPGNNTGEAATTPVVNVEPAADVDVQVVETATTNPPPTMTTPPTADTTATTTAAPATATSTAAATPAATQSPAITYGRTADGAFFHGRPDAPVTLVDYSDFL